MKVFKPRQRIALDLQQVKDDEIRNTLEQLARLQEETKDMYNGLTSQIAVAKQELQTILSKMEKADENLDTLIDSVKSQVSSLVNAAIKYTQTTEMGLRDVDPEYKSSFLYVMKDAISNLGQIVEALKEKAEGVIVDQPPQETEEAEFSISEEAPVTPELTPEPAELARTSSIKNAAVYESIFESIKKVDPLIDSAQRVVGKNKELIEELEEVMGAVYEKQQPEVEETEAFTPEDTPTELEEITEEMPEEGIPEDEVDEAMGMEETSEEAPEESEVTEEEIPEAEEGEEETSEEEEVVEETEEETPEG